MNARTAATTRRIREPVHDLLRSAARRMFFDRLADFWLAELDAAWSTSEMRAEILAIRPETADTKTFVLRTSGRWPGHRAGQFVTVGVEVDGVRVHRCYSLSSPPSALHPTITVRRVPGGRVSTWLHDRTRVGDVLLLGDVAGSFVVPENVPERLLFVAGGSGVTPILSILADLRERRQLRDAALVYYARSADDVIARSELERLASVAPGLRLEVLLDDDPARRPGFDADELAELVPDFARRDTWLCGPEGLMARVESAYDAAGAGERLRTERFVSAPVRRAHAPSGAAEPTEVSITLARSGRTLVGDERGTLLEQLEAAGERPAHGCRMGICNSCRCRKLAGAVENAITRELGSPAEQDIRICVSVPRGDVTLDL